MGGCRYAPSSRFMRKGVVGLDPSDSGFFPAGHAHSYLLVSLGLLQLPYYPTVHVG